MSCPVHVLKVKYVQYQIQTVHKIASEKNRLSYKLCTSWFLMIHKKKEFYGKIKVTIITVINPLYTE